MRTARLVSMANQIAASVPDRAHSAEQTATHLRTFWSPPMIVDLAAYATVHPEDVRPDVHQALSALLPQESPHD